MIEIEDAYRYMISGYFGVMEMDTYPLKEYILYDIKQYITHFMEQNPSSNFKLEKEIEYIKDKVPLKTKLQDALLVLHQLDNPPIDLIIQIKRRLLHEKL